MNRGCEGRLYQSATPSSRSTASGPGLGYGNDSRQKWAIVFTVPSQWRRWRILLANSPGGSSGRKLSKMRRAEKANRWFGDARDEFANSIGSDTVGEFRGVARAQDVTGSRHDSGLRIGQGWKGMPQPTERLSC